ncbi:MAG: TniQ family protein [Dyella sp.]|nr:TniQ family protein [Dyella sp.]
MAANDAERAVVRVRSRRQPIRPLPVVLPPLADELLSSWIARHAAFVGVSDVRFLRHYHIDVPTVRDLDLRLSRCLAALLADLLRCSPHMVRKMTQSRGGRVRSRLVAIRRPTQFCPACAHRHAASALTRGARLRSWMEGWRINCPICGAALEDFRLYTRLFRADPSDSLLVRINRSAREGEQIMDRASKRRGGGSAHTGLMRSLLLPQAPRSVTRETAAAIPRLLNCR